jgi:hypothetical protein
MIASQNTNQTFTSISVSGNAVFSAGQTTFQYNVSNGGSTQIGGTQRHAVRLADRGDGAARNHHGAPTRTCSRQEYSSIVDRSIEGADGLPGRLRRLDGDATDAVPPALDRQQRQQRPGASRSRPWPG